MKVFIVYDSTYEEIVRCFLSRLMAEHFMNVYNSKSIELQEHELVLGEECLFADLSNVLDVEDN